MVSTGTPAMALDFQAQQGFGATTWVDERRRTYRHLGFKRGPGSTLLSLATMKHALRAWRKGFRQGTTQGDPWQQGGVLVVRAGGEAVLCFASEEAGDLAPTAEVMAAARRYVCPVRSPTIRASVVLPHCRGPWTRTTGVSVSASAKRASASRG